MTIEMTTHLSGTATAKNAAYLFDEIAEHFVEHAQVVRTDNRMTLVSPLGAAEIVHQGDRLTFELSGSSVDAVLLSRTVLVEHLFYFAGEEALDLIWSALPLPDTLPNLHLATVLSASIITPNMRRLVFSCADVRPFIGGDMHVQLLVPPTGRVAVWPTPRDDGRISWPSGEDALLSRAYTIRSVDLAQNQVSIDFFQHPEPDIVTPGADFARDAAPGTLVALLGPSSGHLPDAQTVFLAGDESALPAIARIIEELPATSNITALIEVWDETEQQDITPQGTLDLRWVHRKDYRPGTRFSDLALDAIATQPAEAFLWVACEKADLRAVKSSIRKGGRKPSGSYMAWYWSRHNIDDSRED